MKILPFFWARVKAWFAFYWKRYKARPAALRRAIRQCKFKYQETGKRHKVYFLQNKYQVLTRDDIQRNKHKKVFADYVNCTKMEPMAFFDTATMKPSDFAQKLLNAKNR